MRQPWHAAVTGMLRDVDRWGDVRIIGIKCRFYPAWDPYLSTVQLLGAASLAAPVLVPQLSVWHGLDIMGRT